MELFKEDNATAVNVTKPASSKGKGLGNGKTEASGFGGEVSYTYFRSLILQEQVNHYSIFFIVQGV